MLAVIDQPSPNWNARVGGQPPDLVILHYTGMASSAAAIARLCNPVAKVSSHYVIDRAGEIFRLVAEKHRAWHAGVSSWHGQTDINSRSIGIELVNPGHAHGYTDFAEPQMGSLLALLEGICARHKIATGGVLAHSDIAPDRKSDPGERFNWERLSQAGFGLWVPPSPLQHGATLSFGQAGQEVTRLHHMLSALGFGIAASALFDRKTEIVLRAFQRHWRPQLIDGRADASTRDTLTRLVAVMQRPR